MCVDADIMHFARGWAVARSLLQKLAVEQTALNRRTYQNALKVIKTLLDMRQTMTVKESAVQLGCPGLIPAASSLVKKLVPAPVFLMLLKNV